MENYKEILARLDRLEEAQAKTDTILAEMSKIDSMIARLLRDLEGVEVDE